MPKRVLVLFAVAGLLVLAFAGPRASSTNPAERYAKHHRDLYILRMLHAQHGSSALPSTIDVNKVIKQAGYTPKPAPPRRLGMGPYGGEIMPAPDAPDGDQTYCAVAFDDTEYLVVWHDANSGGIYGARVDTAGNQLDPEGFPISSSYTGYAAFPSVAYGNGYFLVAWEDYRNEDEAADIYGALVAEDGTILQNDIWISPTEDASDQYSPKVAFDGTNFLVIWYDDRTDDGDIYGARVDQSGTVLDDSGIPISTADYLQWDESVAFDGTNYLVVWEDYRKGYESYTYIYGARVDQSGTVLDDTGILCTPGTQESDQYLPSVAFDGTAYLVVWQDDRDGPYAVYGAGVSQSGSVLDPDGIEIASATKDLTYPAVAFDGTAYLVAWKDDDDYSIHGCPVSLPRAPGDVYQISSRASGYPAIACGPVEGKALVVYQSATGDPYYSDRIWARQATVTLNGTVDVATVSIVRPVASFLWYDGTNYSKPIPPVARLTNDGTEPCSFNAEFTISNKDDDTVYTSTKIVLGLRPGQTRSVEFDHDSFDLETEGPGLYTGTCATMLASDGTPGNNSKSAVFQGCDFINFFDLGNGGLAATGAWTRDTAKRATWTWPPMDSIVWGDGVYGSYGDDENSTLTSSKYAAMDDAPAIAFQNNFTIDDADDGGNFSYSTTGSGGPWTLLTPVAGPAYADNVPKLGGPGWTGTSDGWKQSVFVLEDVESDDPFWVQWRFASDVGGNDHGWLIDEVAGINCDLYVGKMGAAGFIDTMKVWPNPARGKALVSYTLRKAGNVFVKLYDASGRLAAQVPTNGFRKGPNAATLDATRIARGVYFVKVEGASNFKTTKVIIE